MMAVTLYRGGVCPPEEEIVLRFGLLFIGLCLVNCKSIAGYGGQIKTTADITVEAKHIIVGQVTHVSFVFDGPWSLVSSLVTVRVDKDINKR